MFIIFVNQSISLMTIEFFLLTFIFKFLNRFFHCSFICFKIISYLSYVNFKLQGDFQLNTVQICVTKLPVTENSFEM